MKYFLGLVGLGHHDSAAALVNDSGDLLAAAEEERYTRVKFDSSFPKNSIDFCLKSQNLCIDDIHSIGFFFDSKSFFWKRLKYAIKKPFNLKNYIHKYFKLKKYENIEKLVKKFYPSFKGKVNFHHHHLCHASSVFYCSPFERATIISIDGVGEWETAWFGKGEGKIIKKLGSVEWPNSLGEFYASFTQFLGYVPNFDEYKVMGMAPYGEKKYFDLINNMIINRKNFFEINEKYFDFPVGKYPLYNQKEFTKLFGPPSDYSKNPSKRDINLSASFQEVLSESFLKYVKNAVNITGIKDVCLTGGVSMNCSAVGDLVKSGIVRNVFLNFASADDGCAIGAAFLESENFSDKFTRKEIKNAFLGNDWSDQEIRDILDKKSINYYVPNEGIIEKTATELHKGNVIGWFQDRTEFGQRALGARSILANPTIKNMKDLINQKIKNRENYRPFAPSVLANEVDNYFFIYVNSSPFMTHTFKAKDEKKDLISAVVHIDGTSRVQSVDEGSIYYDLIKSFYIKSNVPLLLNTSFNVNGMPIVNSPKDAIDCFLSTDIDNLSIGSFFCSK